METKTWTLFRKRLGDASIFAWCNPEGIIIYSRASLPQGFINTIDCSELIGQSKTILKRKDGWQKFMHDMTQEELAKGWLM